MPNKSDIINTVNNLDTFLKVNELKGAIVKKQTNGQPFFFTGGFNMVFQLEKQSKKWAFRVWYISLQNLKERFQKISQYLTKQKLSYFADFIYDEKGLLVNGELVDTIHMEWLDGLLLKDYIEQNLQDKQKLLNLAESFLTMCKELHKCKISHGDLQHGNIIIDKSDKIKLIDYDSICVPDIEGQEELVTGLKGYQHPSRIKSKNKTSLKADYFSELIVYLSIIAISEKPYLWNDYKVEESDVLLFSDDDFENFSQSKIYKELSNGFSDNVNDLLKILTKYLSKLSYLDLEPSESYLTPPKINNKNKSSFNNMNKKTKFSFAVLLCFFFGALPFSTICFFSMYFVTMGNSTNSIKWAAILTVVHTGLAFLLKFWKTASSNFRTNCWLQIGTFVLFIAAAFLFLPVFAHYFSVSNHKQEIISKADENFDRINKMFSDYKMYSDERIDAYRRNLRATIVGKAANESVYRTWGFDPGRGVSDEEQMTTFVDMLRTDLYPVEFAAIDTTAQQWLAESKTKVTSWKPLALVNIINTVEEQGTEWRDKLVGYSVAAKRPNENAEPFSYNITFGDVTNLFKTSEAPTGLAVGLFIVLCLIMLFPWIIAAKHPRNNIPCLKLLFGNGFNKEDDDAL
jgi:serine/threonine protein kinase